MTPITSSSPDVLATVAPLPPASAAAPEASAVNWLLTWLGQMSDATEEVPPEESEPSLPAAAPAADPQPVQWLTLLPAVHSFQPVLPTFTADTPVEKGEKKTSPVPLNALPCLPVAAEEPEPSDVPAPLAAEPAPVQTIPVPVPTPTTELPPPPAPVQQQDAPAPRPLPIQSVPPPPPDPLPRPERIADKGEVIWSAELVTRTPATPATHPQEKGPATPAVPPPANPASTVPAAAPAVAHAGGQLSNRQEQGQSHPDQSHKDTPPPRHAPDKQPELPEQSAAPEHRSDPADKPVASPRRESRPVEPTNDGKLAETRSLDAPARPAFVAEFRAQTPTHAEAPRDTPAIETVRPVELDTAKPLRPAQIATLQVDIPPAATDDGAAPMRLIVSQRGEQVNVRLRSWDPSTPVLEPERMQPLLHSLAEKGFSSTEPLQETPIAHATEKPLAATQSFSSDNGQQTFLGADDRQQQNQERQQQQQAFFLRKQMRQLQSGEFDPNLVSGAAPTLFQGVVR